MAHRLPGGRVTVSGAFPVEVEPIGAWPIYQTAVGLTAAFFAASSPAAEFDALSALYGFFCVEAQPTWAVTDHRGVVTPTPAGMLRLPVAVALEIIAAWAETFGGTAAVPAPVDPAPVAPPARARRKAVA